MKTFIVVVNVAARTGSVVQMERDDIFSGDNPGGWTDQDVTGSHETILGSFDTLGAANECLREWLK